MIYRTKQQFNQMLDNGWEVRYEISDRVREIKNRRTGEIVDVSVEEEIL